jgi:bifunctional DNA-binding transcriptional regulator/antitoxin component of YhaV-PrlF toxin-antitoxin module
MVLPKELREKAGIKAGDKLHRHVGREEGTQDRHPALHRGGGCIIGPGI